jgi:hypothetical protein
MADSPHLARLPFSGGGQGGDYGSFLEERLWPFALQQIAPK